VPEGYIWSWGSNVGELVTELKYTQSPCRQANAVTPKTIVTEATAVYVLDAASVHLTGRRLR
jgi:hypothetical protein